MNASDYADDPMKAMVRKYDAAVMEKGGTSIFTVKASGTFQRSPDERLWQLDTPHVHDTTPGPRPDGRPKTPRELVSAIKALAEKVLEDSKGEPT